MPRTKSSESTVRIALIEAAGRLLRAAGYAALSTRRVAEEAGVPLSQIHYHFGSMQGLLLELLEHENAALLERQTAMYASAVPLSEKWRMACQYLEEDLASGYVRILHEMMFAALADTEVVTRVRAQLDGWSRLLTDVAQEAIDHFGPIGPFTARELALLVAQSFLGLELLLLLDSADAARDGLSAIHKVGDLIAEAERKAKP